MSSRKSEKSICLLGDILILNHLGSTAGEISNLLNKADFVLGNLETSLATAGFPAAKFFNLRTDHSIVDDFSRMNVKALALANNHTMDFGFEGLFETIEVLDKHNVAHAGAGRNLEEALKPAILGSGDQTIAFLACSSHITCDSIARSDRPGLAPLRVNIQISISARYQQEFVGGYPGIITEVDEVDLNKLLMALEDAKREADFVVVSIHWGLGQQPMVLDYQTKVAHTLIDHGADIVMGHGPHVLQGIEEYKRRYIFYSLGHFVAHHLRRPIANESWTPELEAAFRMKRARSDPLSWRARETAIGKVVFSESEIKRAEVIPSTLDENGNPQACDNEAAMSILNFLKVVSRYLNTSISIKEDRGIIEAYQS